MRGLLVALLATATLVLAALSAAIEPAAGAGGKAGLDQKLRRAASEVPARRRPSQRAKREARTMKRPQTRLPVSVIMAAIVISSVSSASATQRPPRLEPTLE
jgi:hypothetical protein